MALPRSGMRLEDGARVAVIGGGPAGSLCAHFLLRFAHERGLRLGVEIYEPRDFADPGPRGCNMCGGVVSESLLADLAAEGMRLPQSVVQRGIDAYVLSTDTGSVAIATPHADRQIAAVHRGGGPRDLSVLRWGGLDGFLLAQAQHRGASVVKARACDVAWEEDRPRVRCGGWDSSFDLVVLAAGVNVASGHLLRRLGLQNRAAETARAYITEVKLGYEAVTRILGTSMHVFLMNVPGLEFAAMIPKGDFITICLLGRSIDHALIRAFFDHPAVRQRLPAGTGHEGVCHCRPNISVREAARPFSDRVVLVGDCAATRLYKDGIGAAYRTARAAARAAVFHGVSAAAFRRHYGPICRSIAWDNRFGRVMFLLAALVKASPIVREGVLRTVSREQASGSHQPMSVVLWDMFTGSASYRSIFLRAIDPRLIGSILRSTLKTS